MNRKDPRIAAILSLAFGPLGLLYLGRRFAVCGFAAVGLFVAADWLIGLPIATPGKYSILPVFAWKAASMVSARNKLSADELRRFHTFPMAILASTDLLVGLAMGFAAAVAIYESYVLLRDGEIWPGLGVLLIGGPIAIQIVGILFDIIATAIESRVTAYAPGMKNIFRKGSWLAKKPR